MDNENKNLEINQEKEDNQEIPFTSDICEDNNKNSNQIEDETLIDFEQNIIVEKETDAKKLIGDILKMKTIGGNKFDNKNTLLLKKFPVSSFIPIKELTPESWHRWSWAANYRSFALVRVAHHDPVQ